MALIICSWSGGIDSTALIAQALSAGHEVKAVTLGIYGGYFAARERDARAALVQPLASLGRISFHEIDASWIWAFSPDGIEIPRRNRHIIDHLIMQHAIRHQASDIGLGEYIGADTWVVRDHVGAADADARALSGYLYNEYGLDYRLWSLSDFGEARYKQHRLALGLDCGIDMSLTTNCLADLPEHCGRCYKCIERSVAFWLCGRADATVYARDPAEHHAWQVYCNQMQGMRVILSADAFEPIPMPRKADAAQAID